MNDGATDNKIGQYVDTFLEDRDNMENTATLNDAISGNPEYARRAFRRFLLHVLLEQQYAKIKMARQLGILGAEDFSAAKPRHWLLSRWALLTMLALATGALIILSLVLSFSFFKWESRFDPVAAAKKNDVSAPLLYVTSTDTSWAAGSALPTDMQKLYEKPVDLQGGLVALAFADGRNMMLQGPLQANFLSNGVVRLNQGTLAIERLPVQPEPVLVLGAMTFRAGRAVFAVNAKDAQTFVRVLRGEVQLQLTSSADVPITLKAGSAMMIRNGALENSSDILADRYVGQALQALMSRNANKKPTASLLYEGFAYPAAKNAQQIAARTFGVGGLDGGWGWDGPWRELGTDRMVVRANEAESSGSRVGILEYADSAAAVLLRQGGQLTTGPGGQTQIVRNIDLSAMPPGMCDEYGLGANNTTLWLSFLACSFDSASQDHEGYLQLGDSKRGVRFGTFSSTDRRNWSLTTMRDHAEIATSEISSGKPALIIAQITFRSGSEHVMMWVNPDLKKQLRPATANLQMFVPNFRITEVSIVGRNSMDFDEIRLGSTFASVALYEK